MPYRPGILQVQRVSGLVIRTCVHNSCTHDEVSVLALTYRLTVGRLVRRDDRVAGSSVGYGRVAFPPVEVHSAPVESAQNIIRLPLPEETAFEGVGTREAAHEIRSIHVKPVAFVSVVNGGEVARDVGKARRVK